MMPLLNHLSQKVSALLMGLVALLNHLSQKSSALLMGDSEIACVTEYVNREWSWVIQMQ
jgi:hypothetical protein